MRSLELAELLLVQGGSFDASDSSDRLVYESSDDDDDTPIIVQ